MRRYLRVFALSIVLAAPLLGPTGLVHSQVGTEALERCEGFAFSTEEDFLTFGPEPPDGNPRISDGDLLGPNGVVCARNADLLQNTFDVTQDLGLDAVDVLDVDDYLVAFSTELDSPHGDQFTAGDLLITNGAIIANVALTHKWGVGYDVGLDAVHFVGLREDVLGFVAEIGQYSRDYWVDNSSVLYQILDREGVDIWFSTEGTWLPAGAAGFLDGDLLSARFGTIVEENGTLLPPSVPADVRDAGVDFGLDAFSSFFRDVELGLMEGYFSTEILYDSPTGGLSFSDGDALKPGNGIAFVNWDVIAPFEPKARDLGLDALTFVEAPPDCDEILEINEVGGVAVDLIDPVTGYARKDNGANPPPPPPAPASYDRPFGQWVSIRGNVPTPECVDISQYEYRIEAKEGAGPWQPILTPGASTPGDTSDDWLAQQSPTVAFCHALSPWASYLSDTDGWIELKDYWQAKACKPSQTLNMWNTSGEDGDFSLRLSLREIGVPASEVNSADVLVVLDNTRPSPVELTLYDEAGTSPLSDQCKVTGPGDDIVVTVKGQARDNGVGAADDGDEHFRMYQLHWTGGDVHAWAEVPLAAAETAGYRYYDGGRLDLDGTGTLPAAATNVPLGVLDLTAEHNSEAGTDPPPCGYSIRLRAWDRTIRGRFNKNLNLVTDYYEFGWYKDYMQSFCFETNGG